VALEGARLGVVRQADVAVRAPGHVSAPDAEQVCGEAPAVQEEDSLLLSAPGLGDGLFQGAREGVLAFALGHLLPHIDDGDGR